jgi:hypothetical protein
MIWQISEVYGKVLAHQRLPLQERIVMEDLIKQLGGELGRVFRHMLPGIIILLAARLSHPAWFLNRVSYGNSSHLLALGVIAFAAGNVAYVFHRYSFHQLLDFIFWWCSKKDDKEPYYDWLYRHIDESHRFKKNNRDLFDYVNFRSAQIIFMLITCEIALAFCVCVECGSVFHRFRWCIIGAAIGFWCAGAMQQFLGYEMDAKFVENYKSTIFN